MTSAIRHKQQKVLDDLRKLKKYYPDAHCELNFASPFQLLIATILSAQCTDRRVNMVTEVLFKKYPTSRLMAKATVEDLEEIIKSTGFFKNKAKNILNCARLLEEKHEGEVPQTLEELTDLPGVGRKTANVVLGNAYQIPSGVVVDTHVSRLSQRLGWVKVKTPEQIEVKLMELLPEKEWIMLSHYLIFHGRKICNARKPLCQVCFLFDQCPKIGVKLKS